MELSAVRVGTQIPTSVSGTVWSIHNHAVNIELPPAGRFETAVLLSVVDTDPAMNALSVQVERLPTGLSIGSRVAVRLRPSRSGAAGRDELEIATRGAQQFDGTFSQISFGWLSDERQGLIAELSETLRAKGAPGGMQEILVDDLPAREPAQANPGRSAASEPHLERAAATLERWDGDVETLCDVLGSLIGLGPGMTPAGDDFVCGVLMAAQITGAQVATAPLAARLSATTVPGATVLWLALRRSFAAYLISPLAGLALGRGEPHQAAESILAHGATSGSDSLAGLVWGLNRFSIQIDDERSPGATLA